MRGLDITLIGKPAAALLVLKATMFHSARKNLQQYTVQWNLNGIPYENIPFTFHATFRPHCRSSAQPHY
jgi:hypothetical protein